MTSFTTSPAADLPPLAKGSPRSLAPLAPLRRSSTHALIPVLLFQLAPAGCDSPPSRNLDASASSDQATVDFRPSLPEPDAGNDASNHSDASAACGDRKIGPAEVCDGDTRPCTVQGVAGIQACNLECTGYLACVSLALPKSGAPYSASPVIAGITFDESTLQKAASGSDQFGYTTASGKNLYLAWGDGGGFGGTDTLGRASLGVARIEGVPPSWKPFNVWGGVNPESQQPTVPGKTSNGVIAVNGAIYLLVDQEDVWTNNHLWKSTDLGLTWTDLGSLFNEPGAEFAEPGILQFGPDYQGARDNYIYGYTPDSPVNSLGMFRVDKSKIEQRSSYEFFSGIDGSGNPTWSTDIAKMQPVFNDPNGTEWGVTATYHLYLKRYLLGVRHNKESGEWGLFDAPEPWGPWTTVAYGVDFPAWTYTPDPAGASSDRPAYLHNFPQKWMSTNGKTMWHISDRGDQFNIMKATLSLVGP